MKTEDLILKIQELDLKLSRLEKEHQKTTEPINLELIAKKVSAMIEAPKVQKVSDSHILSIANKAIEKTSVDDSEIFNVIKKHVNVDFINKLYRNK